MTDTTTRPAHSGHAHPGDRANMLRARTPRPLAVLLAALAVAALPTGWSGASLAALLCLTTRHMPGESAVRRSAVAVVFLFGVNTVVLTLMAVAGLRTDSRWLIAAYLVTAAFASGRTAATAGRPASSTRHDRWAMASFVVTFIALLQPFIGASASQMSALLSRSTDGGTHLALVRAVMREDGYIGLLPPVPGTLPGLADYPSGWAGNMALVIEVLIGPNPEPHSFLMLASLLIVGLYSLLSFFATIVALEVASAVGGPLGTGAAGGAAACVMFTTVLGTTSLLFYSSSYAQIAATTLLLAVLSIILRPPPGAGAGTGILSLTSVSVFHTWYLLSPVLAVVLLMHLIVNRPSIERVVATAIPAGMLAAYPVLTGPRPGTQLLARGSEHFPSVVGAVALMILSVVVLAALLGLPAVGRTERVVLASSLVAGLVFVAVVLTVQVSGSGASYYAVKLLYTVFLLTAVGAAAVTGFMISRPRTGGPPMTSMAIIAAMLLGLGMSSYGVRDRVVPLLTGAAQESVSRPALSAVFSSHKSWVPNDIEVWILSGCFRAGDRKATQFVNSLSFTWSPERLAAFDDFLRADTDDISMLIDRARDSDVRVMEVYVSGNCIPEDLPALANMPKVQVIYV